MARVGPSRGRRIDKAALPEPDPGREQRSRNQMKQPLYLLDAAGGRVVLKSLQEVCSYRGWTLLAPTAQIMSMSWQRRTANRSK